jgi:hypothetical protein
VEAQQVGHDGKDAVRRADPDSAALADRTVRRPAGCLISRTLVSRTLVSRTLISRTLISGAPIPRLVCAGTRGLFTRLLVFCHPDRVGVTARPEPADYPEARG